MKNTAEIDRNGVAAINNFLSESSCLVSAIRSGDKDPLFDGEILVYDEDIKDKNKGFIGCVKVQVKSSKRKWKTKEAFPIKILHLKKYNNVGGILFLRPIFKSVTDYRIYVKVLLPVDIAKILYKTNKNAETVSIELEHCESIETLEVLVHHFLENQKHQFDFDGNGEENITLGANESLVFKTIGKKNDKNILFSQNCYLYIEDTRKHLHPKIGEFTSFENEHKCSVFVGEKEFFKSYKIRFQKGNDILVLNSVLEIELNKESTKTSITADENACFVDLLDAITFMQAVASQGEFHTTDGVIKGKINGTFDNNDFLKFLTDTDALLEKYKIDKKVLTFSEVSKHETIITMLTEKRAKAENSTTDIVLDIKELFNKKLLLVLRKLNDGSYSCVDFILDSLEDGVFHVDNIQCSKYIYLFALSEGKLHEYIDVFVGNEKLIISELKEKYTHELFNAYNEFALECIKGYDLFKNEIILQMAEELFCFMTAKDTDVDCLKIIGINLYQILYRKNELTCNNKKVIYKLKKSSSSILEKCYFNILLDNFIEFEDGFNELSDEDQEKFKVWPIWKLYENYLNKDKK